MRVLITGVGGFAAGHLLEHLDRHHPGLEVWGLDLPGVGGAAVSALRRRGTHLEGDLLDPAVAMRAVEAVAPGTVLHLAAASSVAGSWSDPGSVFRSNALGQLNLLEAVRAAARGARVVVASSAEVYGRVDPARLPVTEEQPLAPVSPYGLSKAAQDLIAAQYHAGHGLAVIRLRLFNHTGPRQPSRFVCSSLARQVAEAEAGLRPPRVEVGDLDPVRDFTDVRDVARAWWLAAASGVPGAAYNVCSGKGASVRRLLELLLARSAVTVEVSTDPSLLRAADIPALLGSHDRLRRDTGWRPEIPLEQTLADLLDWWRAELAAGRRPG